VLVNNEETIGVLPRRHRVKAVVRANAAALHSTPLFTHAPLEQKTALVPGRLNRFKGVGLAIRALASAPDWRLVIAGAGDDAGRLSALARTLGVEEPGPVRRARSRAKSCGTFTRRRAPSCLPSLKEGASLVCVEALALASPSSHSTRAAARAGAVHGREDGARPVARARVCRRNRRGARARDAHAAPRVRLDAVARDLSAAYARAVATRPAIAAAEVAA